MLVLAAAAEIAAAFPAVANFDYEAGIRAIILSGVDIFTAPPGTLKDRIQKNLPPDAIILLGENGAVLRRPWANRDAFIIWFSSREWPKNTDVYIDTYNIHGNLVDLRT